MAGRTDEVGKKEIPITGIEDLHKVSSHIDFINFFVEFCMSLLSLFIGLFSQFIKPMLVNLKRMPQRLLLCRFPTFSSFSTLVKQTACKLSPTK